MSKSRLSAIFALLCVGINGPAFAQILSPPPEFTQLDESGVDMVTQDLQFAHAGVSIGPSDHRGLAFTMHYSGGTWRHSFSSLLESVVGLGILSDTMTIGNRVQGYEGSLPTNGDDFLKDGTIARFTTRVGGGTDSSGTVTNLYFLDYLEYPDGVRLTFHYRQAVGGGNSNTRLQSVTTNTGYQMKFYYQSDSMTTDPASVAPWTIVTRVVAINNALEYCDPTANSCALTTAWRQSQYAWVGQIYHMTDAAGSLTRVRADWNTFALQTPGSASENRIYTRASVFDPSRGGQVRKVTQANIDGMVTNYNFAYSDSSHLNTVTATGPLSRTRIYKSYYLTPVVATYTDPMGQNTSFTYDTFNRLKKAIWPEGNALEYIYDSDPSYYGRRGNITLATETAKPGSSLAPRNESRAFPASVTAGCSKTCNKPTSYTDPMGRVTNYTYDPAHGGKLTESLPADDNGIRPVKRYSYAQRYAWTKNSAGNYVRAATPIWLLAEERTCLTSATSGNGCASGASDEIVIAYEYGPDSGPNNLLLRGSVASHRGEFRRTCYAYDKFGNKVAETLPRAGLSVCP